MKGKAMIIIPKTLARIELKPLPNEEKDRFCSCMK
jgi:hypothetical protein